MDLAELHVGQRVMVTSDHHRADGIRYTTVEVRRVHHPDTGAVSISVVALDGSGRVHGPFQPADIEPE